MVLAQVQRIVEGCFPEQGVQVQQYGSTASNLQTDYSDVDLAVTGMQFYSIQ